MTEGQQAMHDVRRYGFAMHDAALFLNTHPENGAALRYYNKMRDLRDQAQKVYNKHFGMLQTCDGCEGNRWTWIDGPWPWEGEV